MQQPAPGILLIADPFLKDPNFMRSVVLLCEHKDEGTFGFVLNKAYEYSLDELVNGVEDLQLPVYMGGPMQMDTIHFLHQYPDVIPGSFKIVEGLYWGGDFETAIASIRSGAIDAGGIRFFIGYSGWGSGQLDTELDEKTWLTAEATVSLVFHRQAGEIWKDALKHLGGEYEMMVNFPIDPQLN